MPVFIALCLGLSYLLHIENPYIRLLHEDVTLYLAISGLFIAILGCYSKPQNYRIWYDLLACSNLLVWYNYWQSFFIDDAPMFFLFPIFFAVFNALMRVIFINKRKRFDTESIDTIKFYSQQPRFHPALIISALLISLLLPEHYLAFPVMMTVFIVRYTINACLDEK